ncbi:phage tail tape measure protein [Enterococcus avium]|uniref:phage tail tape measure protein n=1 Tax=Enterococcus avium TaxID=33945 RepID=UPI00065FFAB3|nr:phage tail tape measure protein [Enterococcus avium]MDB1723288.1 phage tail tape measure protein [Enterococcus avium]
MAFDGSINAIIGADLSQYNDAMNKVVNMTNSGMKAAAAAATNHSNSMVQKVGQIMSKLSANMPTNLAGIAPAMTAVFTKAGGQIQRVIASIGEKIPQPFKSAFNQVASIAQSGYSKISSGFSSVLNSISKSASGLGSSVSSGFEKIASVANYTATKVPAPFKQAFQTIGYTASTLGNLTNKGFLGIASVAQNTSNKIPSTFTKAFSAVVSSANNMANKITAPINKVVTTTGNLATQVGSKLTNAFSNAGSKAANALNSIGSNTDKASSKTASLVKQIVGVGVAFAALNKIKSGITDTVSKAAEFEQKMSNIKAVTGESSETMKKFNDAAIKAGAETAYSASEAADAIGELSKAGVSTKDILNGGLTGALNLATAGELDLKSAAEIASTALNAFKNDNLTVVDAANQLAGAANASATDVGELKFGLSMVSAVASGVGLSFNDTTDALAVFAQNGLKGSDAGTSLKTMLQNLQPQTDKAQAKMQELGLMTEEGANQFFDANGKIKSFADISQLLKDKLSGLTQQQQQQALKTMFGTDAVRAATIAMNEGADGANSMQEAISKVTAAEVAKEKLNNLKGAIEGLSGSFETLQIKVGTAVLPLLTTLVQAVDKFVDKLGQSQGLDNFVNILGQLNPILDHFVNGTKLSGDQLIKYRKAVMDVTSAIKPLIPLASVVGGALALDAALPGIKLLSKGFISFSGVIGGVVSGPIKLFQSGISNLIGLFPKIGGSLAASTAVGMSALNGMTTAMATIMQVALAAVGPAAILGLVVAGLGLVNNQFGKQIDEMLNTVTTKGPELITNLVNGITSQLPQLMASGTELISKFASAISTMIPVLINAGMQIVGTLVQGVGQNAPSLISSALQVVTSFISSVASALPQLINMGMQLLLNLVNGIIQNIPQIVSSVQQILSSFVGSITENLPQIIQTGIQILLGLIDGLTQMLPQLLPVALNAILQLIQGLMSNIPQLMQGAVQIVNGLCNFIVQNLPMILQAAIQIIMAIVNGLVQNLPQIISAGIQIIISLVTTIIQMLPQIAMAGLQIITSLASAILEAIPNVLQGAWDGIKNGFSNLWNTITGKSKETSTNVSNDATSTSNSMGSAYSQANMNITASMNQMNTNVSTLSTMSSNNAINAAANAKNQTTAQYQGMQSNVSTSTSNLANNVSQNTQSASSMASKNASQANANVSKDFQSMYGNVNQTTASASNAVSQNMNQASSNASKASNTMYKNVTGNAKNINTGSSKEISTMTRNVNQSMNNMSQTVTSAMSKVTNTVNSGFSKISTSNTQSIRNMVQTLSSGMNQMRNAFSSGMNTMVSIASNVSGHISSAFSYLGNSLYYVGYNAGIGLNNGLVNAANTIYNTANRIASNVANQMRAALDIHSPSRVMAKIGGFIGSGLVKGMQAMLPKIDGQALAYANAISDQEYSARSVVTADTRAVTGKLSSSFSELSDDVQNSPNADINLTIEQNWDGKKVYNYIKTEDARNANRINLINKS